MLKKSDNNASKKVIRLPDGQYLYAGLLRVTFKDGKPNINDIIGCYHTIDGQQYAVDTTGQAKKIMPMLVSIPSAIIKYTSKDGVEAIEEDSGTSDV